MVLGATEGESLNRSSIPEAGCDLFSSSFAGIGFSVEDDAPAAAIPEETCISTKLENSIAMNSQMARRTPSPQENSK